MKEYWPCAVYEKDGRTVKLWTYDSVLKYVEALKQFKIWEEMGYNLVVKFVEVYEHGERVDVFEITKTGHPLENYAKAANI